MEIAAIVLGYLLLAALMSLLITYGEAIKEVLKVMAHAPDDSSMWDTIVRDRKELHVASYAIDGGEPVARAEVVFRPGKNGRAFVRVVPGEQGNCYLFQDLNEALSLAYDDALAHRKDDE